MRNQSPFKVCALCRGEGSVVNPSIDAGGLSAEDFDQDPDFAESYMAGAYDIQCPRCKGMRVIREAEEGAILKREREAANDRRLAAREDGDFEAYCSADDPRFG